MNFLVKYTPAHWNELQRCKATSKHPSHPDLTLLSLCNGLSLYNVDICIGIVINTIFVMKNMLYFCQMSGFFRCIRKRSVKGRCSWNSYLDCAVMLGQIFKMENVGSQLDGFRAPTRKSKWSPTGENDSCLVPCWLQCL